jgi:transcriptional regulator with XRE-family HTH domain
MIGAIKMAKKFVFDRQSVGRRIRKERERLGLTQERVAERTEFTGQYWSLIERGSYQGSVGTYLQIASALGVTLDDLFYDDAETTRVLKAYSKDILLIGCTSSEKIIISETLLAMRAILEKNR